MKKNSFSARVKFYYKYFSLPFIILVVAMMVLIFTSCVVEEREHQPSISLLHLRRSLKQGFSKLGRPKNMQIDDAHHRPFRDAALTYDGGSGDSEGDFEHQQRSSNSLKSFASSESDSSSIEGNEMQTEEGEAQQQEDQDEKLIDDSYVSLANGMSLPTAIWYHASKKLSISELKKATQKIGLTTIPIHGKAKEILKTTKFMNNANDEELNRVIATILFIVCTFSALVVCACFGRENLNEKENGRIKSRIS